ncbi:T9SS C-terminal target domain-containing protein [candidate division KSB1 bacterium]|nr:MAG: T9SS C-terminal target domain-containing protein [candidate division KSB1 bacterium]MBC6948036.1 T9SS C-terminal target domain-containing protein [candidate division KSB1 bacterium]MCE7943463.1 T9SS C-terminal target domain-containing protein [Chlorobi bacterium CHB1]MDL1877441.1 T9SS type A sorting domain-containing protein [Cytophagia bacterium CHB2]
MKTFVRTLFWLCMSLAGVVHAMDDWTAKNPATKPSLRFNHDMAYIGGDQVLLFGGILTSFSSDGETWVYDLNDNAWTQKAPAASPSPRESHAMAYIGGDQVLLFGGYTGVYSNDTWLYDLSENTWTQRFPSASPSGRVEHGMVYLGDDQLLLFGGVNIGGSRDNETWIYDLSDNAWSQKFPPTSPSPRYDQAMAYIGDDQVLLFGGYEENDETWVYDVSDNAWTQKLPASSPAAQFEHAMAYFGGDQVLLFGWNFVFGIDGETWVYDLSDNTWMKQSPSASPTARVEHAMADIGSNRVLLFGGYDGEFDDETWLYEQGPEVKSFVFLADKITLKRTKQDAPAGDMHSNGTLTVEKGDPSTYNSNLTAVGKITILKENTINGDVTSATAISNSGTINGTRTIGPVNIEPLPCLSYSAGGANKTVPSGGVLALPPGSYNVVTLKSGGTLKLTSGAYFINELRYSGSEAVIEINLASGEEATINVVKKLQLGKEVAIQLLPNGESDSKLVTFNSLQSTAVSLGKEAYCLGNFNAPYAKVALEKNSQLRGALCAKEILVERDCLFLPHDSPSSLPGPGNLPKEFDSNDPEVAGNQEPVTDYRLEQNYPNPFNPETEIRFALPEASQVVVSIFNVLGEKIRTLVNASYEAGYHSVLWDGKDEYGDPVTSGVYLYQLRAGEFSQVRKMSLIR